MGWDDYNHRNLARDYDGDSLKCQCQDCGKAFNYGDEGDNEKFCLRCCHKSLLERQEGGEQ